MMVDMLFNQEKYWSLKMLPEQKEQLEKLKRARVKEDIPKDLAIAIQAFLKQAAIVGEYELDSMP